MKQQYQEFNFRQSSLALLGEIEGIMNKYRRGGYVLTVRQLYYQLVTRNIIENTERSYKNTAQLINDGRLAGELDWDMIEDRTREFMTGIRWSSAQNITDAIAKQYNEDRWTNQTLRVFVIVEKEALVGVLERTCTKWDAPLLAARGYPSASVLREFATDEIMPAHENGQEICILHLGDHDPSGLDMSRDLEERLNLFAETDSTGGLISFNRIALNMDQIRAQRPPPNPAKSTDARFLEYRRKHGEQSWELDALDPEFLNALVESKIVEVVDDDSWGERDDEIEVQRKKLLDAAKHMAESEDE